MLLSKAWRRLRVWDVMPGSTAVLEMTLRQRAMTPDFDAYIATYTAVFNLSTLFQNKGTPPSCHAQLSLLATVHKLLLLSTPSDNCVPPRSSTTQGHLSLQHLSFTHISLCALLSAVCERAQKESTQKRSATGVASNGQTTTRSHTAAHSATTGGSSSSSSTSSSRSTGCELASVAAQGSHQLQALVVMVLVWLSNVRARVVGQGGGGPDRLSAQCSGWEAKVGEHNTELACLASKLLLPPQSGKRMPATAGFKQECAGWNTYALKHFHGRLLPGCSHLRCTNMSGISEETLKTLLCSGCRRVRYCSAACQRAAWVGGGHSAVCGKGEWMVQGSLS